MLRVNLICIGRIKEKYYTDAIAEYSKRLSAFCKFQIIELPEERIRSNTPNASQIDEVLEAEGKRSIEGKLLSSEELSKKLDEVALGGKSAVDFIIGGSYGLSAEVKSRADLRLSMSRMTFPHQLARVILSEQIYRAFEISTNGKYHK